MALPKLLKSVVRLFWGNWKTNELWQRMVKCIIAYTVALIIAIHPAVIATYGTSTFLAVQTTIFAHPGQRMGMMIQDLAMVLAGSMSGLAWGIFGLYLSSLVYGYNQPAAYTIRGCFLLLAVLFHGFVRSNSPRLFVFVLMMLIATVQVLLGSATAVSEAVFTTICYPILTGAALLLVVNLLVFPELSSSFLGSSTIDTLSQTMDTLDRATHWFITPGGDAPEEDGGEVETIASSSKRSTMPLKQETTKPQGWFSEFLEDFPNPFGTTSSQTLISSVPVHLTTFASLTDRKGQLRSQMGRCSAAQNEVNFEISFSPLPPAVMKPISTTYMTNLVQSTITLIGACENKFIILARNGLQREEDCSDSDASWDSDSSESGDSSHSPEPTSQPSTPSKFWKQFPRLSKGKLDKDQKSRGKKKRAYLQDVEDAKPVKEIEASSAELLESILEKLRGPVQDFEKALKEAVALLTSSLSYCFDVAKLPSGALTPTGIRLEEIDLRIDHFSEALACFDRQCTEVLRLAATAEGSDGVDLMPRMETFLISSFLLGLRQAAMHVTQMLHHTRGLVDLRQRRQNRIGLWLPQYANIRKWLSTGGELDGVVLPNNARKEARRGRKSDSAAPSQNDDDIDDADRLLSKQMSKASRPGDEEAPPYQEKPPKKPLPTSKTSNRKAKRRSKASSFISKIRHWTADVMEWTLDSDDVAYAFKLAIAFFLVAWPGLISSWASWYANIRGIWAPLQLILVFEVVVGSSLLVFFVRLVGVILGCTVGYVSYEIARGNRAAMVVVLFIGVIPSVYIQLATKYVKAGMVAVISMSVVALATVNAAGTAVENFYTRLAAFVIGGTVAVVVELAIYPVRARDRLVESISSSLRQIQNMQATLAIGVDDPAKPDFRSEKVDKKFSRARNKAQGALAAAETFFPFCSTEPRIKGSFKPLAPIYEEIMYVLHQIIDRMDSVVQLRKAYGSSILEDLNPEVYAHRRNVAASTTLTLFSVNEALTTWFPLPQFLPSTRIAQLRLVNRVRQILQKRMDGGSKANLTKDLVDKGEVDEYTARIITERKFLSWSASTAGLMEITEYLEELVELVKLLVGVNAFRSGMLERPNYRQYVEQIKAAEANLNRICSVKSNKTAATDTLSQAASLKRAKSVAQKFKEKIRKGRVEDGDGKKGEGGVDFDQEEDIPRSLQRVGTRMWQDNAAMRRRAFSNAGDVP